MYLTNDEVFILKLGKCMNEEEKKKFTDLLGGSDEKETTEFTKSLMKKYKVAI